MNYCVNITTELRKINIALIVAVMQKKNIQRIYFGINTHFVENGVVMIQSITYVKTSEDEDKKGRWCNIA